jgi:methylglutaconyl-CoA hydratase
VRVTHEAEVSRVQLARPDRRNALDAAAIAELTAVFGELGQRPATRAIVLCGEGKSFCSGADISYMRSLAGASVEENLADARRLAALFAAVCQCPKPVVARVHGSAIGGGAGLVAASDIAIAAQDAVFGFTEARLGILPAVVSPFVVPRIGLAAARELFLTGERFGALRARAMGLVARVVPEAGLDRAVAERVSELALAGPEAQAAVKRLLVRFQFPNDLQAVTAAFIAEARASEEGREGLAAFLERRPPAWIAAAVDGPVESADGTADSAADTAADTAADSPTGSAADRAPGRGEP